MNNLKATNGKLVRARKLNERSKVPLATDCRAVDLILQSLYPKERQSAEWGVRGFRGCYHRVTTVLPSNPYKRYRILSLCVHLSNYRTRKLGRNEIRTVYENDVEFMNKSKGLLNAVSGGD